MQKEFIVEINNLIDYCLYKNALNNKFNQKSVIMFTQPTNCSLLLIDGKHHPSELIATELKKCTNQTVVCLKNYFDKDNPYLTRIAYSSIRVLVLKIRNYIHNESLFGPIRDDFAALFRSNRMLKTCVVDVYKQNWFDGRCIDELIAWGGQFSYLNTKKTKATKHNLVKLIKHDSLASPCYLKMSSSMPKCVATALLQRNILLRYLNIKLHSDPTRYFDIITKLLIDDCFLKIRYNGLTNKLLKTLNDKLTRISQIKLKIAFDEDDTPNIKMEELAFLLSKTKSLVLELENYEIEVAKYNDLVEHFVNVLPVKIDELYIMDPSELRPDVLHALRHRRTEKLR